MVKLSIQKLSIYSDVFFIGLTGYLGLEIFMKIVGDNNMFFYAIGAGSGGLIGLSSSRFFINILINILSIYKNSGVIARFLIYSLGGVLLYIGYHLGSIGIIIYFFIFYFSIMLGKFWYAIIKFI